MDDDEVIDGPDADFVRVATFQNTFEALLAQTALEAVGIPSLVPDQNPPRYQKQFADLLVRRVDEARAVERLKEAGHR